MSKFIWIAVLVALIPFAWSKELSYAEKEFSAAERQFSYSMLRTMNENGNINTTSFLFSPYSTFQALLLAYIGSNGTTEESLGKKLQLDWALDKDEVREFYFNHKKSHRVKKERNGFVSDHRFFIEKEAQLL